MSKSRPLESSRLFPYIAWGVVIGFAAFVYNLTTELKHTQAEYADRTSALETRASQDPATITDFTP